MQIIFFLLGEASVLQNNCLVNLKTTNSMIHCDSETTTDQCKSYANQHLRKLNWKWNLSCSFDTECLYLLFQAQYIFWLRGKGKRKAHWSCLVLIYQYFPGYPFCYSAFYFWQHHFARLLLDISYLVHQYSTVAVHQGWVILSPLCTGMFCECFLDVAGSVSSQPF